MASTDGSNNTSGSNSTDDVAAQLEAAREFQLALFALNLESANNTAQVSTLQSIADRVAQT